MQRSLSKQEPSSANKAEPQGKASMIGTKRLAGLLRGAKPHLTPEEKKKLRAAPLSVLAGRLFDYQFAHQPLDLAQAPLGYLHIFKRLSQNPLFQAIVGAFNLWINLAPNQFKRAFQVCV